MQTTEQYVRRYLAPFTFVGLLSSIVIIFLSIRDLISDGRSYYIHDFVDGLIVTAVFFMSICLSLWFYKNDIKRYLITKGEKFNAKIIAFNKGIGRGNGANIHFVIQFVENGKKMKFYSQGYNVNPLKDLVEAKCYIYKKNNKYIDSGYNICNDNKYNEIFIYENTENLCRVNRRKDRSFVN